MFSSTFSRLAIFLGLCSCVVAAPLNALQARTEEKCADNRLAPCTCHGALGLRLDSTHLSSNCPAQSFKFTNPASGKDGTVALVPDNLGEVQCDHIVELQFIANQIQKVPGICRHFQSTTGTADFQTFFNTINSQPNLVFVQSTVNHAKGIVFSNRNFKGTTEKAAAGVVSYLGLLQSNGDATRAADTIDAAMTRIMGAGNGFQTFQAHFTAAVDAAKKTTQRQVASGILSPAPVPGDPFVHQTESTNVRCGGSKTIPDHDCALAPGDPFVDETESTNERCRPRRRGSRTEGKPTGTADECTTKPVSNSAAKPAAKPAANPVAKPAVKPVAKPAAKPKVPKPVAKPAAKPATKPAVKPAAKPPVKAKPVAKPAAKPVAKPVTKPVPKKPVAKPAAKPVTKPAVKPAAKPAAKAKPVAKPVAKPAAKPATKPVPKKPVAKPAAKPVTKPAAKPAAKAKPVAKPVAKPAAKPATKLVPKKPVAKPAAKPVAKPVAKKPAAKKPVAKPVKKPTKAKGKSRT